MTALTAVVVAVIAALVVFMSLQPGEPEAPEPPEAISAPSQTPGPITTVTVAPMPSEPPVTVSASTATASATTGPSATVTVTAPPPPPSSAMPAGYDGNGVRLSQPSVAVSGSTASFRGELRVARPVTLAGVRFVVRRGSASAGDVTASGAATVTSSRGLSGSRSYGGGTYTVAISYSRDGSHWLSGPAVSFSVLSFNSHGVWLGTPNASTSGGVTTFRGTVQTNRSVRFYYLQVAVRDAEGRDVDHHGNPLDTAFTPNCTVNGSRTITGQHSYVSGRYTALLAYSLDGTHWVNGSPISFTVP